MIIKIYILFTLLYYIYSQNKNNTLGLLLVLAVLNEVLSYIFKYYGIETFLKNNLYVFTHQIIWLFIIRKYVSNIGVLNFLIFLFIVISFILSANNNISKEFSFNVFIFGALLYLSIFIFESYIKLKKENFAFFLSSDYLLLFSPILFFLGMSFMFSFRSHSVTSTHLFNEVKLYTVISYFVNIVYYTVMNVYIFKEKQIKNAT